ncbi:unnamed protein product [Lathyrus sativus]|nr:unnamed protein product [Lathyrus sativus]
MLEDSSCNLCHAEEETMNHLFFSCQVTSHIWKEVLDWFNISHDPQPWDVEMIWLTKLTKGKGWKAEILRMLAAETIYNIWGYKNDKTFGNTIDNTTTISNIIDCVIYRGWNNTRIRKHLVNFMM